VVALAEAVAVVVVALAAAVVAAAAVVVVAAEAVVVAAGAAGDKNHEQRKSDYKLKSALAEIDGVEGNGAVTPVDPDRFSSRECAGHGVKRQGFQLSSGSRRRADQRSRKI
jgi:opacity protein-like surface antigen